MILNLILEFVILMLGSIFSLLPAIVKLPDILGLDIDTALVSGVSQLYAFLDAFWPIGIMFQGFLFLMGYYALKIGLRFLIGHRAPG